MGKLSAQRLALVGAVAAVLAIVVYVGATIASAIEYNRSEAAGTYIDGPPAAILIAGDAGMILGVGALVLLLSALVLHGLKGRKTMCLLNR
jgi:hypothetical protein